MQLSGTNHPDTPSFAGVVQDVIPVKAGKIQWFVRRSTRSQLIEQVLSDPDRFLGDSKSLIANSPLITMGRITPRDSAGPVLLLRRLNYGRLRHRLRDVFRQTRAERAFWHGMGLERVGVTTARALAAGVRRVLRWPIRSYLLTEWVPNAVTVQSLLDREHRLPRELVCRLADLVARMHDHGFSHRDLNLSNILLDELLRPILIDLDGVRKRHRLDQRRVVADLTRFAWEFVRYPVFLKWSGRRFLKRYCRNRQLKPMRRELDAQISQPILRRLDAGITWWKR